LILAIPSVYAESDSKRSRDGFNDGRNAARTELKFNPACDPTGAHTIDGQHTSTYCNAWSDGYISTWNSLHGQTYQTQTQQQDRKQNQAVHTWIAISCKIIQSGSQGQEGNQGEQP